MDTAPNIKLKEVSKAFSKRFAGSSSVKDMPNGKKEIIIQGDHMEDVAAMIVDKFKIPAVAVFMDVDGEAGGLKLALFKRGLAVKREGLKKKDPSFFWLSLTVC